MCWPVGHHDNRFAHLWCAAPLGAQDALIAEDPERFFRPPYVGGRGWIGLRLDADPDWDEVAAICEDAYCTVAPDKLLARLHQSSTLAAGHAATPTARCQREGPEPDEPRDH